MVFFGGFNIFLYLFYLSLYFFHRRVLFAVLRLQLTEFLFQFSQPFLFLFHVYGVISRIFQDLYFSLQSFDSRMLGGIFRQQLCTFQFQLLQLLAVGQYSRVFVAFIGIQSR